MSESKEVVPVETFAHGLSDKQLACRDYGHTWRPSAIEVVREGRTLGGYVRIYKCASCRTERRQTLDSHGDVVQNGYVYANGYLADNVQKGFGRQTFRLESVNRWLDTHQERKAG
jgi:ABC-type branched-subunit amino acid transport system substrate-binding protein